MTRKELNAKANELKELKVMAEELAVQIEALEDEIKADMVATDSDTLLLDSVKITWKPYTISRFDSKAFKLTHGELYNQYCKTVETKRFLVA